MVDGPASLRINGVSLHNGYAAGIRENGLKRITWGDQAHGGGTAGAAGARICELAK